MKNFNKKYFPNFDFYQKAISYPYTTPSKPFSFIDGKCVEGVHISLNDRVPILSVGSNRSPYQLKNKFTLDENLCVTPAILYNSEIVYSASISPYGSIPATQWPLKGAEVILNVLWLNERQLNIMHLTEGIGIAYNFVELDEGSVVIEGSDYTGPVYGYVSVNGVYDFGVHAPNKILDIVSKKSLLETRSELEALCEVKDKFDPDIFDIRHWIEKVTLDKKYRMKLISKMSKKSIKPKNPPWQMISVKVDGNNMY